MQKNDFDIFVNYKLYPNADKVFSASLESIEKVKDECLFVLDTNALLVPYSTGSQSLEEIGKVFQKLKTQKRLIIPGQVAREFANNRPEKLKEIFQQLNRKRNALPEVSIGQYPLLEGISDYKETLELEKQVNDLIIKYRKNVSKVIDTVKNWTWNDPVSILYRKLFSAEMILDLEINQDEIKKELSYRFFHKIPPGYKDESKPDDGIGDLLIWLAILEIGKTKRNVVFVSGDEKTDWFHRSEKQGLYPRFELLTEFKNVSENKAFHIIRLSELLTLLGADEKAINEVAIEERSSKKGNVDLMDFQRKCENAVLEWYLSERDDMGIKPNQFGFPDLEIHYDDGTLSGVEVFALLSNRGMIVMRVKDRLMRAYYEVKEGKFKNINFVFVAPHKDFSYDEIISSIERMRLNFNDSAINVQYIYGYLNDKDEFEKIK